MKVKCEGNEALLEVTDDSTKVTVLDHKGVVAILCIRSLGYYKIQCDTYEIQGNFNHSIIPGN